MKTWTSQENILHWFWNKSIYDEYRVLEFDDELVEWCWQHNCTVHSDYIVCPNKETFILFGLRWS